MAAGALTLTSIVALPALAISGALAHKKINPQIREINEQIVVARNSINTMRVLTPRYVAGAGRANAITTRVWFCSKNCEKLSSEIRSGCIHWDTATSALLSISIALGFASFVNSRHADLTASLRLVSAELVIFRSPEWAYEELQKAGLELTNALDLTVFDNEGTVTSGDRMPSIPDDLRLKRRLQHCTHFFLIMYLIARGCGS
jgi:hypothetical protein